MKQEFEFASDKIVRKITIGGGETQTFVSNRSDEGLSPSASWWQSVLRGNEVYPEPQADRITIVDAFCGSGGLGLGVRMASEALQKKADFLAAIDTDEDATVVHRHNLGTRKSLAKSITGLVDYHVCGMGRDARFAYEPEIIASELSDVSELDVFIAGPPCQGHSNLNNYTRRQDPRNDLYVTAVALGVALGSQCMIIENVPTVRNSHSDVVSVAVSLLRSSGYGVSTAILKADQYGAAQTRSRFFILAIKGKDISENFLEEQAQAFKAKAQPVSWAIADLVGRYSGSIFDSAPELTQVNLDRVNFLFDNDLHNLPDEERPDCHKEGTTYPSVYGRMYWDKPSQTITTGIGTPGQGRYIHPRERRLITPHEAARIQGYPEWFDFCPKDIKPKRKNLAKWIGDAVHPILGYVVMMVAYKALSEEGE